MNRKTIFGVLAIFVVIASIATVSAFAGKFSGMDQQGRANMFETREGMSPERPACNEQIVQAIENGDYEAWKKAAVNSPMITKILNEDDFKILVQLHQAKQDGDYTKVKELSEHLGLPCGSGRHNMPGNYGRGRMN